MFELPHLESPTIREGLDYYNQLLALRDIVSDYDFDTSDRGIDRNLIRQIHSELILKLLVL